MGITLDTIKRYCTRQMFDRGYELYLENRVLEYREHESQDLGLEYLRAVVEEEERYFVTGIYRGTDDIIYDYTCECAAYKNFHGICKHCVALFLEYCLRNNAMLENQRQYEGENDSKVKLLLQNYSYKKKIGFIQPEITGRVELEPTLVKKQEDYELEFKIGMEFKYVLKNLDSFVYALRYKEEVAYGKRLSFIHDISAFTREGQKLATLITKIIEEDRETSRKKKNGWYSNSSSNHGKELSLVPRTLEDFMDCMGEEEFFYREGNSKRERVYLVKKDPDIFLRLTQVEQFGVRMCFQEQECLWGEKQLYIRQENCIYQCSRAFAENMGEILKMAKNSGKFILDFKGKHLKAFCKTILPVLRKFCIVEEEEVQLQQYSQEESVYKVYIEMTEENEVLCEAKVVCEETEYNLMEGIERESYYRNIEKESILFQMLMEYFSLKEVNGHNYMLQEENGVLYELLREGISRLNQIAEVYVDEKIKNLRIRKTPKIMIGIMLKERLLELNIGTENLPMDEIKEVLESYRKRKRYHRMKNGDFLQLDHSSLEVIAELRDALSIKDEELKAGQVVLPKYRAVFINQVVQEHVEQLDIRRNHEYKALIREMKAIEESDFVISSSLQPILRNYQKIGYRWLRTLDHLGFGGILADDMGLGKTLQIIAVLQATLEEESASPSFIISPASLVYNWKEEIEKFSPNMRIGMVTGTKKEREEKVLNYAKYDVLITSYDLVRRDQEVYHDRMFRYTILDEAQVIKNHTTLVAKAVKSIKATTRFALTGTPIENRLNELWSLFDFVMPGMLYSYSRFREEFEIPILLKKDQLAIKRLQHFIKPFILRRLKDEVLKELPEKEEHIVYTKLEGEQLVLYNANVLKLKKRLEGQSKEEFKNSKLQTLAELTKLRQLCCQPSLIYEDYKGEAAKIDTCMELVDTAIESGHKVLLFSQFTRMLDLLEVKFKDANISFYKLNGSTKKEDRIRMVNQFQDNEVPLFLISLKAGGTGLNLTAANIVIHFDPWWNQAAERQATDRVYRIGQKQSVTVYKIIAKDTIEENILRLQRSKQGLVDTIISENGVSIANLTPEDFMSLLESSERR